ncbi:spatacsin isoform X3 [Scleropages formosus]|nr:spatacsin isoform X3 [Scleropages formosus]XP_018621264.2 spatacsin isoform X3 [Scleropages formosus]XP_018621265.2 spatacsin isoform X3 [Scleropages formosus]XP_018621267.2 spatacsin isoform X3 [Scleropages formosus]
MMMSTTEDVGDPRALEVSLLPKTRFCQRVEDMAKAQLSPKGPWLCCLGSKGRIVLVDAAQGDEALREADGAHADFVWEEAPLPGAESPSRLLALGLDGHLRIFELDASSSEDGSLVCSASCSPDFLLRVAEQAEQSGRVPAPQAVTRLRMLSFAGGTCVVLLNSCVLVQLLWPKGSAEPEASACCVLGVPTEVQATCVDCHICRGLLFLLTDTGHIYVFGVTGGQLFATVDLPLCHSRLGAAGASPSFHLFQVSQDLSTLVVASGANSALAVNLNHYFRTHPEYLEHHTVPARPPLQAPEPADQDRLSSSQHSCSALGLSFQVDRSWEARLASMYDKARALSRPVQRTNPPWFTHFPHSQFHWAASGAMLSRSQVQGSVAMVRFNVEDGVTPVALSASEFSAVVTFTTPGNSRTVVVFWDLEKQDVVYHRAEGCSVPVQRGSDEKLCLLLGDGGLSLVLFSVSQEELLNRLMVFGSAGTVDSLCHLNAWDRCSIPIHALQAGLKNHQLDTVDFFLKSKENFLCPPAGFCLQEQPSSATQMQLRNVEALCPALDLLASSIKDTHTEAQSRQFSEQLLNVTLTFLSSRVREILSGVEEPDDNLQQCVSILDRYICELRVFMKRYPWPVGGAVQLDSSIHRTSTGPQHKWHSLSTEEVIRQAVAANEIPQAQAHLRTLQCPKYKLPLLRTTGLQLAFQCLTQRDLEQATSLLRNMGFSVKEELKKIFLHTDDGPLRDFVMEELRRLNCVSEEEGRVVNFIKQVEGLRYTPLTRCKQPVAWKSTLQIEQSEADARQLLQVLRTEPDPQATRTLWTSIRADWVQHWDSQTQSAILLSRVQDQALSSCAPDVLWMYLTSLHDCRRITQWIESLPAPDCWPPLSADIVNHHTLCSSFLKDEILDMLARRGIFIQAELSDFEQLLWRLGQAGGVMQDGLPVPQFRSLEGHNFHTCFIHYCLEKGLRYLLYSYTEHYSLTPGNCPALADCALYESHPWFEMLVKVQEITRNLSDPEAVFGASLTNAQILTPGSQASVSSMLLEGHSLLALSTIMFSPGGIDQVVSPRHSKGDPRWKVDLQLLKMALSPYPKLKSALFPQSAPRSSPVSDVSLYHLLQALRPLDPSKLFRWQSANTLSSGGDASELPHFSCPLLVSQHALVENLHFLYYLCHGRPSFAFGTFLVQQMIGSVNVELQVADAIERTHRLALQHFHSPAVVAACVCFCEMLGVSSLRLRVDVAVLSLVLKAWSARAGESNTVALRESLVDWGRRLVEKQAAEELLIHLEAGVRDSVERKGLARASYEASKEWALVVQFCHLHSLPLSAAYLLDCATDAQWLHFLFFVQLHSYPPEQVRTLVAQFDSTLRAHLSLAFQSLPPCPALEHEGFFSCPEAEPAHELFQVLLQSQEQQSAWCHLLAEGLRLHCPTLAVLAACHQEADMIQCLCVWVLTSVDNDVAEEATAHIRENPRHHVWNLHDLSVMWRTLLKKNNIRPLIRGFQLFQKDCPLIHMMYMFELCFDHKNYQEAKKKVLEFQKCLLSQKASSVQDEGRIPIQWSECQASVLLLSMLQQCTTQYELRQLLHLLADVDHLLKSNGPDFKKLSLLSDILQDTPVPLGHTLLESYSPEALQGECSRIVEQLQAHGLFTQARRVSELGGLPIDTVVINELLQELRGLREKRPWARKGSRIAFWRKCHEQFCNSSVDEETASEFFRCQAQLSTCAPPETELLCVQERALLFTMAGHWLCRREPVPLGRLEELERKLWECRVRQQELLSAAEQETMFALPELATGDESFEDILKEFSFSKVAALNRPELLSLDGLPVAESPEPGEGPGAWPQGRAALARLVGHLLDEGCIHEASRVCRYFSFYHPDLLLVLRCRSLASGDRPRPQDILPSAASPDTDDLLKRSFASSSSLSSLSSFVVVSHPEDPVVVQLQTVAEECHHGKNYCKQVLSLYELSKELKCPYSQISAEEPLSVLCKVLLSQQPDRYKKAQAFIAVQGLAPDAVAETVSRAVVEGLMAAQESGEGGKQIFSLADGREAFLHLARLCGDPNLVGSKLMDHITTVPLGELACTVELLILAHDCFSLTCNMEGIGRVLQAARHLSHTHLAHGERYGLLVRLLTGIGRYNEMTYVFDLLNQNHRFEMLLRKKVESNATLKTALLDYIKRCLPGDSEKHNMVALCFSMCREIGENHEGAARTQLKLIESQPWAVTPELKSALMKVLTLLKDAAESYSKDSCLRQGLRCVKLAKLVTLQLHLLNQGQEQQVINLRPGQLLDAIVALPRCYQAFVVAEAYDFSPDWAEVLYQKVVLGGDFSYLDEFKQPGRLQPALFEDVSKKVSLSKSPGSCSQNLRKLLQHCDDVYTHYKLAYEHKFFDVANVLLQDSRTGGYLSDRLAS